MGAGFEEQYYEAEELWAPGALGPFDQERIEVATSRIPSEVRSLVDVGCGNGLFVNYLVDHHSARFGRIVGVDRSAAALRHVRAEQTRGSVDALPFENDTFDLATCMEVLEHLPVKTFEAALREIVRVSRRYVLVTVPNDQDLSVGMARCRVCGCIFHPDYHLRSFDARRLHQMFSETHDCLEVFPIAMSKAVRPPVMRALHRLRRAAGLPEARPPKHAMCPMCGDRERGQQVRGDATGRRLPPGLRRVVSRVVVVQRPRWLGALYRRR